jgi:tartrate dehydrogenase/decarboxylase/D-malate dehydrogenase
MGYRIALIPGDGIGLEVIPEGVRVLKELAGRFAFTVEFTEFPYSCGYYSKTGKMMPEDGLEQLKPFDAILLGAVGAPGVPDHVSLWGLLIPIRRGFDQYVNLRPVRLLPGIKSPLAGRTSKDIDFVIIRENTEG